MAHKMYANLPRYLFCLLLLWLVLFLVLSLDLVPSLHLLTTSLLVVAMLSIPCLVVGYRRHIRQTTVIQIQRAIYRERYLIAVDLHDAVVPLMFSAGLIVEAILADEEVVSRETASRLEKLHWLTATIHTAMRHCLLDLRPTHLKEIPLDRLITELARIKQESTETEIQSVAIGTACYPSEVHRALYHIVNLALSNALLHAQASSIVVRLILEPDNAFISIEDDGIGFDPAQTTPGHFGLPDMRSHANDIGASLNFDTLPGPTQPKKITCVWRRQHGTHQIGSH